MSENTQTYGMIFSKEFAEPFTIAILRIPDLVKDLEKETEKKKINTLEDVYFTAKLGRCIKSVSS